MQNEPSAELKYSRTTELRLVFEKDVFKLAAILDDNDCWRKLMEIIPKKFDAQKCSASGALNYNAVIAENGLKYSNDDIRLIEKEYKHGRYDWISQILIDEWKTSGRSNERPTLGVLLQLLIQAELYRAADFVAENLLKEPRPQRPSDGPAACIELASEICENMEIDFDSSYYPSTAALNDFARYQPSHTFNRNFDTKYIAVNKHISKLQSNFPLQSESPERKPSQTTIYTQNIAQGDAAISFSDNCNSVGDYEKIEGNIPILTDLLPQSKVHEAAATVNRSFSSISTNNMHCDTNEAPIPILTLLLDDNTSAVELKGSESQNAKEFLNGRETNTEIKEVAANEIDECSSSSLSNDNIDNEGENKMSLSNLCNFDQHSSNTNSSLTNVTGTSGENSFELTNDSSLGSYVGNIPDLSSFEK